MAKITYEDKVPLKEEADIPEINKVTAQNLNDLKNGINDLLTQLGLSTDNYSSVQTYSVNARVCYQNQLWKCTTAITTPEEWNASHWELVPIIKF